jgi:hypothetical protein
VKQTHGECAHCKATGPLFVAVPSDRPSRGWGFYREWDDICEACASKEPEFYYRYIDCGGTYSPFTGTREEVAENLARVLDRDGRNGLEACEVFRVPGKYRYASDLDKMKHGRRVYFTVTSTLEVKL